MSLSHRIYYVRHGQCLGNVTGETLAPEEDVITEFGRKQAELLGECLQEVKFTKAYASTYQRSIETAKGILSKAKCAEELIIDSRIKEREMGDLIGLKAAEIFPQILEQLRKGVSFNNCEVPGGETTIEFVARIRSFFEDLFSDLKKRKEPSNILIVSHGLTMVRFLSSLESTFSDLCTVSNWEEECRKTIPNTGCTEMEVGFPADATIPVITFKTINETKHLESLKGELEKNKVPQSDHAISKDAQKKMLQAILKIPGAKEELSGCLPV